jgi:hypothetical protein
MIAVDIKLDLSGMAKYRSAIDQPTGPVRDMLVQWATRYRAFIQRRFDRYSKGGGDWPSLATSTIAGRRKGKGKRRVTILRDTGTLFAALNPAFDGRPGSLQTINGLSVTVGYGGPQVHTGGRATIAAIAAYHDQGGGNLPQRQIIVPPDSKTLDAMAKDAERALTKLAKEMIG